jgi:D-alanyl-D-alanine dipeptidase
MDKKDNTTARREYWAGQIEKADEFISGISRYPVEECGETLVSLRQAVKNARLTVKFSQDKERLFYLREGTVKDLIAVAREMNNRGWFLEIKDCFRTAAMQKELFLKDSVLKPILKKLLHGSKAAAPSPELVCRHLCCFIAAAPKLSTHMTGAAVDLAVCHAGNLCELNCGAPYMEISETAFTDSPFLKDTAVKNRRIIRTIMEKHGFTPNPFKFWQFSQGDIYSEYLKGSGKPARYGAVNFSPLHGKIAPVKNLEKSLLPPLEKIQEKIDLILPKLH